MWTYGDVIYKLFVGVFEVYRQTAHKELKDHIPDMRQVDIIFYFNGGGVFLGCVFIEWWALVDVN